MTPHYILTRCAYNPALFDDTANRRRLDIFTATTVSSLRASHVHLKANGYNPPTWLLAVHLADPLLSDRVDAAKLTGLNVVAIPTPTINGDHDRHVAAHAAYRTPWTDRMHPTNPKLTTRIDDDDAFATDTLTRLYRHLDTHPPDQRRAYIFPQGHRIHDGHVAAVRHESNAWLSLYSPAGDPTTAVTFAHRNIADHAPVVFVDDTPSWLWVRHPYALSGWRHATDPISPSVRRRYPVDWTIIDPDPDLMEGTPI